MLDGNGNDDLFDKDSVVQTEGLGVQIKVAWSWRVVGWFVIWPNDGTEGWRGNTIFGIAKVVIPWRICP
jgi:hypothetical protein